MTILLLEDDAATAEALRLPLIAAGATVFHAATLHEARTYLNIAIPDIALLDIRLKLQDGSEQSGIDLADYLRQCQIPFIFITSLTERPIRQQALQTNPYAYLVKPVQADDLASAIMLALRHNIEQVKLHAKYDVLLEELLLPRLFHTPEHQTLAEKVAAMEGRFIMDAMTACQGDIKAAAKQLGIHPKTLRRKIKTERFASPARTTDKPVPV